MIEDLATMFANRLKKNVRRVVAGARRLNLSCYRVYDGDIPEIPLVVDWYEGRVHVGLFAKRKMSEEEGDAWLEALLEVIVAQLGVEARNVFVKTRQRQKGSWQYGRFGHEGAEFVVSEAGLEFKVNLSDYLDTGLFLDHRITRQMVRDEAKDKRFLNLFAYTGSFSVYAAAAGAKTTTTIDMSNTYLRWAEENMALNGFKGPEHDFVRADILAFLQSTHALKERFELVVVDPPTFSNSKKMADIFDVQRDYAWLLTQTLEITKKGGVVYFSSNFGNFSFDPALITASQIVEITDKTTPGDFKHSRPHRCWRIVK